MIIRLFLVLLISLPTSLLAMEEVAVDESVNFCMDTQAAINNDTLAAKYPDDEKIVRLVALRSGLCDLLAKEIIELDFAIDLFNKQKTSIIREQLQDNMNSESKETHLIDT